MKTITITRSVIIYILAVIFLKFFSIISLRWVFYLLAPIWVTIIAIVSYLVVMFTIVYFSDKKGVHKSNIDNTKKL